MFFLKKYNLTHRKTLIRRQNKLLKMLILEITFSKRKKIQNNLKFINSAKQFNKMRKSIKSSLQIYNNISPSIIFECHLPWPFLFDLSADCCCCIIEYWPLRYASIWSWSWDSCARFISSWFISWICCGFSTTNWSGFLLGLLLRWNREVCRDG